VEAIVEQTNSRVRAIARLRPKRPVSFRTKEDNLSCYNRLPTFVVHGNSTFSNTSANSRPLLAGSRPGLRCFHRTAGKLSASGTIVRQQVAHDEKIARMLAVERGHDLACIELGEGHDLHFGKAEFVLHGRHHWCHHRIVYWYSRSTSGTLRDW
jgi:hypothetical protein